MGWRPTVDIDTGLDATIAYFKETLPEQLARALRQPDPPSAAQSGTT